MAQVQARTLELEFSVDSGATWTEYDAPITLQFKPLLTGLQRTQFLLGVQEQYVQVNGQHLFQELQIYCDFESGSY